ncbi:hypothetical protein UFOVP359_53 [uncultured Caudovirales phage]|jgi:hypothetical protein|uniref:Uncharacterized protein n=1 Tax=uncultured Caudovirales phage TaxID=2100421 RepID=A0A6J7WUV2_9CAUD|nr:hypothetical protein UFOVP359_53 [uncultured Caudovirales phage]
MSNQKNKLSVVENKSSHGIYVWILPNGEPFTDGDGNTLNVPSVQYDISKMKSLAEAAAYWGKPEGSPKFMPGVGRVSDTQAREDINRMAEGLTPYGDSENWRELFNNAR